MTILDRFRLDGKVAVVTGGGQGIGRGIAIALAEAGADVVVGSRTQADLDEVVARIEETGRRGPLDGAEPIPSGPRDMLGPHARSGAARG